MSKGNSFETSFLSHIFNNAAITGIGDSSGLPAAATSGSLYVRLCTAATTCDDSTIGTECAYTGYVAKGVAVIRSVSGWSVSSGSVTNTAAITFGACTAGSETIRYFEIWKNNTSASESDRLFWGQLTTDLAVSSGVTPEFGIGSLIINED
jgi:hypothetical protein